MRVLTLALFIFFTSSCIAHDEKVTGEECVKISSKDFKDPDLSLDAKKKTSLKYTYENGELNVAWCRQNNNYSIRILEATSDFKCSKEVATHLSPCPFYSKNLSSQSTIKLAAMTDKKEIIDVNPKETNLPILILKCSEESYFYVCKNKKWYHAFLH